MKLFINILILESKQSDVTFEWVIFTKKLQKKT